MAHATIAHPIRWVVFCIAPNYGPRWPVGSSWRSCQQRLVRTPMSVKPWHSVLYTLPPRPIPVIKLFQQSHLGLASRGGHEAESQSKERIKSNLEKIDCVLLIQLIKVQIHFNPAGPKFYFKMKITFHLALVIPVLPVLTWSTPHSSPMASFMGIQLVHKSAVATQVFNYISIFKYRVISIQGRSINISG